MLELHFKKMFSAGHVWCDVMKSLLLREDAQLYEYLLVQRTDA